ncbi:MAG: TetR/AcrR family transcriptional regulator [Treponema sp.]|nr:TetR/AcrR family transcriptional regulator [Treponema sp.]
MPKVSEGYFQEKRNEILNAAFEVCKRKPAYELTMSDIVAETGLSQGGVYKYFDNIFSVYSALIDKANLEGNHTAKIDEIMALDIPGEIKLQKLFMESEKFFSEMLLSYNKILYELSTFCMQNPEHDKKIKEKTSVKPVFPYLAHCVSELIITQVKAGYFKPIIPVEDILTFIVASFDGIIRDVTINKCYNVKSEDISVLDEKKLINSLYVSTLKLLGK